MKIGIFEETKEFNLKIWETPSFLFLAMGFLHTEHSRLLKHLGILFDKRGNINVNSSYGTNVPGVFAAGDASMGASLVVNAIYHGREAAKEINRYLMK